MKKIVINFPEAQLKHLNTRTEGNTDEPARAVDLKFEGLCDGSVLQLLAGSETTPLFWASDGSPLYTNNTETDSRAEFEGGKVEFGDMFKKMNLTGVKVNKFKYEVVSGGMAKIKLRCQFRPTDEEFVNLSHQLLHKAPLIIEAMLGYAGDDASHLMRAADEQGDLINETRDQEQLEQAAQGLEAKKLEDGLNDEIAKARAKKTRTPKEPKK